MLVVKFSRNIFSFIKSIVSSHKNIFQFISLLSFALLLSMQSVEAAKRTPFSTEKNYLRIGSSALYEKTDLEVTSLGLIGFDKNLEGSMDLSFMESSENGNAILLNAGAGYGYSGFVSIYAGLGIALGYNLDDDEVVTAYYPEAGFLVEITKKFGISLSGRRYFNLYDATDSDDVIMLGFVFR